MHHTMLPEDFKKLLQLPPEKLVARLNDGEPGSPTMIAVKSVLEYQMQKALLIENKKVASATIAAACVPAILSLVSMFWGG
jgi:hypothetical protein